MTEAIFNAAIALAFAISSGSLSEGDTTLEAFMAYHGCAIGPETRAAATEAGHSGEAFDALMRRAKTDGETTRTGDWIVLSPELCTIRPPLARSAVALDDPEVIASTSAIDAYAEWGERGCFIEPELTERLEQSRGWTADEAHSEYIRFLAENLANGSITFYSNDSLSTPVGFQLLTQGCTDLPDIEAIRSSQALRDQELDALIRADAPNVECGTSDGPSWQFADSVRERSEDEDLNAWIYFEVKIMAMGGGWYEGHTGAEQGTSRPPLCRYPENPS